MFVSMTNRSRTATALSTEECHDINNLNDTSARIQKNTWEFLYISRSPSKCDTKTSKEKEYKIEKDHQLFASECGGVDREIYAHCIKSGRILILMAHFKISVNPAQKVEKISSLRIVDVVFNTYLADRRKYYPVQKLNWIVLRVIVSIDNEKV